MRMAIKSDSVITGLRYQPHGHSAQDDCARSARAMLLSNSDFLDGLVQSSCFSDPSSTVTSVASVQRQQVPCPYLPACRLWVREAGAGKTDMHVPRVDSGDRKDDLERNQETLRQRGHDLIADVNLMQQVGRGVAHTRFFGAKAVPEQRDKSRSVMVGFDLANRFRSGAGSREFFDQYSSSQSVFRLGSWTRRELRGALKVQTSVQAVVDIYMLVSVRGG